MLQRDDGGILSDRELTFPDDVPEMIRHIRAGYSIYDRYTSGD